MYKLEIIVEDNSETALLTTFNKDMTRIMGKLATYLIKYHVSLILIIIINKLYCIKLN